MKIFYLKLTLFILISLHIVTKSKAQYVTIPDANFASYLTTNFPSCMTGSQLDTTCTTVLSATKVNVSGINILDLTGIQYFKNLDTLLCSEDNIGNIPALPPTLTYLQCSINNLTSLPPLPAALTYLDCSANQLNTLPTLPASLKTLNANENELTTLPGLPSSLITLYLNSNNLTALPALPATLSTLECGYNQLVNLPSLPATLTDLNCSSNNLTGLPALPATLTGLYCTFNSLYCLPILPAGLQTLWAINNHVQCISGASVSLTTDSAYKQCSAFNPNNCALQNYVLIPDANFVTYLTSNFPSCMSGSWLDTTCPAILTTTSVSVSSGNINDLTGIQYFKGLNSLDCSFNNLVTLPPLPDSLTYLNCNFNNLISLPPLPDTLNFLALTYNNITCLPPLPAGLQYLYAQHNHVACIYDQPTSFIHSDSTYPTCNSSLNPNGCPVANLVLIPDTNFRKYLQNEFPSCMYGWYMDTTCTAALVAETLYLDNLAIANLAGIQYFKGLTTLTCTSNSFTSLPPLPPSLAYLNCSYNNLDSLSGLPASLITLVCISDSLSSLPALGSLTFLNCSGNKLDSLPGLPASLTRLYCTGNKLQCLPALPNNLAFLYATGNAITCLPNIPTGLTSFNSADQDTTYQVCNSPNGCAVLNTTSISAATMLNGLQVFPNPSTGIVTINCPFNATGVTIAGMDGKTAYQTSTGNSNYTIDLGGVSKGVYVVQIFSEQGAISQKLVLQ